MDIVVDEWMMTQVNSGFGLECQVKSSKTYHGSSKTYQVNFKTYQSQNNTFIVVDE